MGVGSHELFQTFNQDALTCTFVIFAVFLFQSRNEQTVGSRAIWADGLILVYSITDRKSFEEIQHLHNLIDPFKQKTVVIIFGNKSDLEHKRQVPEKEAASLAEKLQCSFFEGSASEGHTKISEAFHELYKEVAKRKKERCLFHLAPYEMLLEKFSEETAVKTCYCLLQVHSLQSNISI